MLPAIYHKTGKTDEIRSKAQQLLEDIETGEDLQLLPAYLTKDQRYKIAVARALMLDPHTLLLDSPFSALNFSSAGHFKQFLINKARNDNLLLILATHDTKFALEHSDQILFVSRQHMLQFSKTQRIQDCDIPEVCDYITR
jgi:ABC-type polar amino acid transport system ATPase subunit